MGKVKSLPVKTVFRDGAVEAFFSLGQEDVAFKADFAESLRQVVSSRPPSTQGKARH